MDYEFYILYLTRPVFSLTQGYQIFTKEERILVSGFLSAIDSFAKSTMKANLESLSLSNSKIYFKQSESKDFLYILIIAYAEELTNIKTFFSKIIPSIENYSDSLRKLPSQDTLLKIENLVKDNQEFLLPKNDEV